MSNKVMEAVKLMDKPKCPFAHPTGYKRYPERELKRDKETGLRYIGFTRNAKGENVFDNWYDEIQKPKDSCNVRILLERAVQSDNTAILNQREKVSADLANLPDNLLDTLNTFQSVKNYFEHLPAEVKKDFGNNPYEFVKRSGKVSDNLINYYNTLSRANSIINPIVNSSSKKKDIEKDGDV